MWNLESAVRQKHSPLKWDEKPKEMDVGEDKNWTNEGQRSCFDALTIITYGIKHRKRPYCTFSGLNKSATPHSIPKHIWGTASNIYPLPTALLNQSFLTRSARRRIVDHYTIKTYEVLNGEAPQRGCWRQTPELNFVSLIIKIILFLFLPLLPRLQQPIVSFNRFSSLRKFNTSLCFLNRLNRFRLNCRSSTTASLVAQPRWIKAYPFMMWYHETTSSYQMRIPSPHRPWSNSLCAPAIACHPP